MMEFSFTEGGDKLDLEVRDIFCTKWYNKDWPGNSSTLNITTVQRKSE